MSGPSRNIRDSLNLKLPEPSVSSAQPWADDVLDRQQLGSRLTNLIRTQSSPFTISIHGNWGTGKTFLLKRWQKDLENDTFKAIYFNAWEDDFCSDPLLAILGQMAHYFKDSTLAALTRRAMEFAIPLLRQNLLSVLNKSTGLTLDIELAKRDALVEDYLKQRTTKDELKTLLSRLSEAVVNKTGRPLIVIIDELDRCRPTFATELLERVKHIFDVQHIVFVFGINRDQLCVSFQSEYGQIDADTYLRKFFDIEFNLPDIDTEVYARHVIDKHNLNAFFSSLGVDAQSRVHLDEFRALYDSLPRLWAGFGLSLRDIDYCVGSVAMVGKNLQAKYYMFPLILSALIPLKLKNPELYRRFAQGKCLASEVVDYLDISYSSQGPDKTVVSIFDRIEAYLYFAENTDPFYNSSTLTSINQLELLVTSSNLSADNYLSKRIKSADKFRVKRILETVRAAQDQHGVYSGGIIGYVATLIDLHQNVIRR